ncbi:MAG: ATP-binding protein [Sedimentisphaerales bacterium]|jgi:PAS domain S-box-containing protein|nr:ATP-binding protein [Sedimentisphaerales bacterium]
MTKKDQQSQKRPGNCQDEPGVQDALDYLSRQARELARANAYAAELVAQLEQANQALKEEVSRRIAVEEQLRQLNAQIDTKVRRQTAKLQAANQTLGQQLAQMEQLTRQLQESQQRWAIIFNAVLTSIFIVDAQTHTIVDANPLAVRMVGLPKEQIIGKVCHQFVCPAEQGRCPITDLGQTVDCSERVFLRADGTRIEVLKTVTPVNWQGRDYLVESFIDISDRKRAEQRQAELVEQLTKVNRQLNEFAYVVSHDLKAPLRGIRVLSEWIIRDYGERLGPDGRQQLQLLAGRVQRMQALIDGILQYSRLDRQQAQQEQIDLTELVAQVIDLLAPPEHIQVAVAGPLPTIVADRTRIGQVFQNLISNAIRYMDKPIGKIEISCQDDGQYWRFAVKDNGPGIEAKYFEKIFQLFQTLSSRDDGAGTGIGLAVLKKIIEQYGGRVWVESQVGEGSTFLFTLPKGN